MPIPALNEHGLLPAGVHDCTVEEMHASFAWNEYRRHLVESFTQFLTDEIHDEFGSPVYADGSFVTDKERPSDLDVVLDLHDRSDAENWRGLMFMREHQVRIREQYGLDFWINFPRANDFVAFFQYAGHKTAKFRGLDSRHPKGILRVG